MNTDTWISLAGAVGEWGIVFVIYYEWEGQRLDSFLADAEAKIAERKKIFAAYCGIENSDADPRNERFRQMLDAPEHAELRDICDENVRLFSRIGARLPYFPPLRNRALDWHVVVLMWEIVGPYVVDRRRAAGPSFAVTFIRYALASVERLLKQERDSWTIVDPDRSRKKDVTLSRDRLLGIEAELIECLAMK